MFLEKEASKSLQGTLSDG